VAAVANYSDAIVECRYVTIADNIGGGVKSHCNSSGTGGYEASLVLSNSIVANNGAVGVVTEDLTPTIDYNDVYGHSTNYYDQAVAGLHDISVDPEFVAAENYHLDANSPCRDACLDIGIPLDLDASIRPQVDSYDMGCYEMPVPPPPQGGVMCIR